MRIAPTLVASSSRPSPAAPVPAAPFAATSFSSAALAARIATQQAVSAIDADPSFAASLALQAAALLERGMSFPTPVDAQPLAKQAVTLLRVGARQLAMDLPASAAAAHMHWGNALERFGMIETLVASPAG